MERKKRGRPPENKQISVVSLRLPKEVLDCADVVVRKQYANYRDRSEYFRIKLTEAIKKDLAEVDQLELL